MAGELCKWMQQALPHGSPISLSITLTTIVHELRGISTPHSGRMRVRASCPLGLAQAEALAGALATLPGISEIRVNPRLGSLLFHYEDAESRETALTLFVAAGGVDGPLADMVDDPAPGPGEATLTEGLMPVFQYVFVRPLLPMALRIVNSFVSAVPFLSRASAPCCAARSTWTYWMLPPLARPLSCATSALSACSPCCWDLAKRWNTGRAAAPWPRSLIFNI